MIRMIGKPLYWITGVMLTIGTVGAVALEIDRYFAPDLHATVDCENWQAPFYIEEELKGVKKAGNACESLKVVMPDDKLKKLFPKVYELSLGNIREFEGIETYDTDNEQVTQKIDKVHKLTFGIIKEIEILKPYEVDNVSVAHKIDKEGRIINQHITSMHTILVQNTGHSKSENVVLQCEEAQYKYVEYKKEGKELQKIQDFKRIPYVHLGILKPKETASLKAWSTCEPDREPKIKIDQDFGPCASLFIRTPVNGFAEFVNKYSKTSVLIICLICYFAIPTIKSFLRRAKNLLRKITIRDLTNLVGTLWKIIKSS